MVFNIKFILLLAVRRKDTPTNDFSAGVEFKVRSKQSSLRSLITSISECCVVLLMYAIIILSFLFFFYIANVCDNLIEFFKNFIL